MTTRQTGPVVLALLALLAGMAGCGGRSTSGVDTAGAAAGTASADPNAPSTDDDVRAQQLADCLRARNVIVIESDEDGHRVTTVDKDRTDVATVDAAMKACGAFLPQPVRPQAPSAEDLEKKRLYAKCVRDNGVPQFPDPDPRTGEYPTSEQDQAALKTDQKFLAATEACRSSDSKGVPAA
jgi:hypothetical protein